LVFSCPRTASIRTATNCDLIVLTKQDLDRVLAFFPDISEQVRTEANERFNKVKEREATTKSKSVRATTFLPPAAAKDLSHSAAAAAAAAATALSSSTNAPAGQPVVLVPPRTSTRSRPAIVLTPAPTTSVVVSSPLVPFATQPAPAPVPDPLNQLPKRRAPLGALLCFGLRRLRRAAGGIYTKWRPTQAIDPLHPVARLAEAVFLALSVLQAFLASYNAAFRDGPNVALVQAMVGLEAVFAVYMMLFFHWGVVLEQGQPVTDLARVARLYLSGDFRFDLLAILPFDVLYLALSASASSATLHAVAGLQLVHLVRLFRIPRYFSNKEAELRTDLVGLRIVKLSTLVAFMTLWFAEPPFVLFACLIC
jgi:hypothetical protein